MTRLARDWRALAPEQRLAGVAAVALLLTMLLPWYQQNAVVDVAHQTPLESRNLNAFQVFSFIEAAVLVVALAVVYLLYARAEGRDFHLPGSDGAVVLAAGLWVGLLLVLRLFDKPAVTSHGVAANVGVQWGIFFALAAAGALAYAGSRMRANRRPEPPFRHHTHSSGPPGPSHDVHASSPPGSADVRPRYPPPPAALPRPRATGAVAARKATEQLSFDDPPPESDQRPA